MSMKTFPSIDRFYFILGAVLLILILLVFFTFKVILTSFASSRQIDEQMAKPEILIKKDVLDKTYEKIFTKENMSPYCLI